MSYRLRDRTSTVFTNITQKANVFLRNVAEEVVRVSSPNTPKKEGFLRKRVLKQVLGLKGKISWESRYAAIQEKKQFRNYTTPGTGPHYAENAINKVVRETSTIAKASGLTT